MDERHGLEGECGDKTEKNKQNLIFFEGGAYGFRS